ncbi:hypothetical protein ACTFIR_004051 [Dictyostelium discoideum]
MKLIILIFNIILINYVLGQSSDDDGRLRPIPQQLIVRNFKPDRNPDFGIRLSDNLVTGIMQPTLGDDKRPKYCCGENAVVDDQGVLIVNDEQSFNKWFNSDDLCSNYFLSYQLDLDLWDNYNIIGGGGLFAPTDGVGFGDPTLFPEYAGDQFNQYQCFELHLSYIPLDEYNDFFRFSIMGEIWFFFNNTLVADQAGQSNGFSGSVNFYPNTIDGVVYNDENYVYPIDLYSCVRSIDVDPETTPLTIMGSGNFFCSWIDDGGICNGLDLSAPCVDDPTQCVEPTEICGNCVRDIPRICPGSETFCTVPVCLEGFGCTIENKTICDDLNACTIDTCDDLLGCSHEIIPNCHCNSTTCFTEDLCYPKYCSGDLCLTIPIDCAILEPDCPTSVCFDGQCSVCEVDSSSVDISTTGVVTTTGISISTIGPVSTTDLSISTIGFVTTTGVTASTIGIVTTTGFITSTTDILTTASSTSTTGTPTTTSISTTSTTGATGTTTITTSTTGSTGTIPPIDLAKCSHDSCPPHYYCYQLTNSYTCISKEFYNNCQPERLIIFY